MRVTFCPAIEATTVLWAVIYAVLWLYMLGVAYAPNTHRRSITDRLDGFIRFQDENLSIQTFMKSSISEWRHAYIKILRPGNYRLYYDPDMFRAASVSCQVRFGQIVYADANGSEVALKWPKESNGFLPLHEEFGTLYHEFSSTSKFSLLVFLAIKLEGLLAYELDNGPRIQISWDQPINYNARTEPESPTISTGRNSALVQEEPIDREYHQVDGREAWVPFHWEHLSGLNADREKEAEGHGLLDLELRLGPHL